MSQSPEPYRARRLLDVPAEAAWRVLTSQAGARRWLADRSGHSGGATAIQVLKESLDIESRHWLTEHVSEMPWEASIFDGRLDEQS